MRLSLARSGFAIFVVLNLLVAHFASGAAAQTGQGAQKKTGAQKANVQRDAPAKKPAPKKTDEEEETDAESDAEQQGPEEVLKVETDLVAVPVIATDRDDVYVPDLRQDEFTVYEDGVKQEIIFFATVSAPFHVVLMIDTSASTQEKLRQIQSAAVSFVEELQPEDKVKVISFDDKIRDSGEFTSDHSILNASIRRTAPGRGTKLYDAMTLALGSLRRVRTRKAIVIFTDGVDSYSDRATYEQNKKALQESGIIVYPIRYETREEVERLVRQQQRSGQAVDLGSILGGIGGGGTGRPTTPTTFPSEDKSPLPIPVPTGRSSTNPGGIRWPGGVTITRDDAPNDDPRDNRNPNSRNRDARFPDRRPGGNDTITAQLDLMYSTGEAYLNDLANESGGSLYRADTLFYLPDAFAKIAAELRTQYSVGYYPPPQTARDGKYHKIRVKISRKDVSVRARPGYRAPAGSR